MKVAVIGSNRDFILRTQREPFLQSRNLLKNQYRISTHQIQAESPLQMHEAVRKVSYDVVILMPFWDYNPQEMEAVVRDVKDTSPQANLIFIDPFAQTGSRYFGILPYVDFFLKRQRLKDISLYQKSFIGGSPFTEFLQKNLNFDLHGWSIDSSVPENFNHKIISGWNLGASDHLRKILLGRPYRFWGSPAKEIDIFCRLSLGSAQKKEWYFQYRMMALEEVQKMSPHFSLAVSGGCYDSADLIPKRQYFHDLQRSRIVVSPFGWGETCWRDFEAVCYGCLLVKPSMEHIATEPNIFIPGQTYVPIRWDFSDLEETCQFYLSHPEAAATIVQQARTAYQAYFSEQQFLQKLVQLLTPQQANGQR